MKSQGTLTWNNNTGDWYLNVNDNEIFGKGTDKEFEFISQCLIIKDQGVVQEYTLVIRDKL